MMTEAEWEAQQAAQIEELHQKLDDIQAGHSVARHRQVDLANIVDPFEFIHNNIHTRNRWWTNAKRLDELEAKIDSIPDAKSKRKDQSESGKSAG